MSAIAAKVKADFMLRPFKFCGATAVATCLFDAPEPEGFAEKFCRQVLSRLVGAGSSGVAGDLVRVAMFG